METQQSTKKSMMIPVLGLIAVIGLVSYTLAIHLIPFRAVGTCIGDTKRSLEAWEKPRTTVFRIEEIGKRKYKLVYLSPETMRGFVTDRDFGTAEIAYKEVNCGDFQ